MSTATGYAAELDIDPPCAEYTGDNAFRFALNQNLARRHMNESQPGDGWQARLVTTKAHSCLRKLQWANLPTFSASVSHSTQGQYSKRQVGTGAARGRPKIKPSIAAVDSGEQCGMV